MSIFYECKQMLCKSRFFISNANAFHNDADAIFLSMMQMSHAEVRMQSLSMMVPAYIFNYDANVSLQGWRCKNLVVQIPFNGYVMMQMLLVGVQ